MAFTSRFAEDEQPHWFSEPALVVCPRCGKQAVATLGERAANERDSASSRIARLTCGACGHSVSAEFDTAHWVGPVYLVASGRCGQCGRALGRSLGRRSTTPSRLTSVFRCPGCQHRTTLPIHVSPEWERDAVDPWFGLPLWLQMSCCGEVLWARNASHLQFLANYVGATLRERKPNRNGSAVSRLPKWIKSAKNRAELLAGIAHLQQTLLHD